MREARVRLAGTCAAQGQRIQEDQARIVAVTRATSHLQSSLHEGRSPCSEQLLK
jgi:hypothetical protein